MRILATGAICLVMLLLQSCAFQRAADADKAKSQMIGMSMEQVLACMGVPAGRQAVAQTEVWSYPSGGDSFSSGSASGFTNSYGTVQGNAYSGSTYGTAFGSSSTKQRYCVVNIVMEGGHVSAVNYSGRTGGLLTSGEQCAFAVENCIQ